MLRSVDTSTTPLGAAAASPSTNSSTLNDFVCVFAASATGTSSDANSAASPPAARTTSTSSSSSSSSPPQRQRHHPNSIQIFVLMPDGKPFALNIAPDDTIADVKAKVEAKTHLPQAEQRFIFGGRQLGEGRALQDSFSDRPLEDGSTLSSYGIGPDSTLQVVLRLLGGANYCPNCGGNLCGIVGGDMRPCGCNGCDGSVVVVYLLYDKI
jgi:hypothetical protein